MQNALLYLIDPLPISYGKGSSRVTKMLRLLVLYLSISEVLSACPEPLYYGDEICKPAFSDGNETERILLDTRSYLELNWITPANVSDQPVL